MPKSDEEERRERLELLKLKQGLISESEVIPTEQEKAETAPLTAKQKAANFFYYYKWIIIIAAVAVALVTYLIVQIATTVKPDISVMVAATARGSELVVRSSQIETALEQFCPDFNGDGKIHVGVIPIDLGAEQSDGQYYIAQMTLFDSELTDGEECIIVSEERFFDFMLEEVGMTTDAFLPIGGGCSVPVSETALGGVLGEFPEDAHVYFLTKYRDEPLIERSEELLNAILP